MLFSSFAYICGFLPVVVVLCVLLRRWFGAKAAQGVVLVASLVFYGWFKPSNLWLLAASLVVNFLLAKAMQRSEQPAKGRWLRLGLVLNIAYLCAFKYVNFALGSVSALFHASWHVPEVGFPLGISFFTLSQIMYLLDTYEGLLPAMGLFDYATFVSFFPYVVSGPIAKADRIQHQFKDVGGKEGKPADLIARGFVMFTQGLVKKVLFADALGAVADKGFTGTGHMPVLVAWASMFFYALQLYSDFSGYSDMAMGSAMMLGVEIPRNFDMPFRSKSITEFWTRWHISLSQFIATYVYTPIIRALPKRTLEYASVATMVSMFLAGLWHGPNWTFVAYGVLLGVGLVVNQYWRKKKMPKLPAGVSWAVTFLLVMVAFLMFRADTMAFAGRMILSLVDWRQGLGAGVVAGTVRSLGLFKMVVILPVAVVMAFWGKASDEIGREFKPSVGNALAVSAVFLTCLWFLAFNTQASFVYFKF